MGDGTFATAREEELPLFMRGPRSTSEVRTLGAAQDAELELLYDAARMSMGPFDCPDDGLEAVGRDFGIERFKGEPNGTAPAFPGGPGGSGYRGRLCDAWLTRRKAGSPQAIIDSLVAYGFTGDLVLLEDYELPGQWPNSWDSRWRVILGPDFGAFGPAPWSPTVENKRAIVGQVRKWKALHSLPIDVVLRWTGDLIGIDFVIGSSTIGGTGDRIKIMPLIGVDFIVGEDPVGAFEEY